MKKPTLEEVKDYFKNAETVQCIFNKHSLSEIDINNIQLEYGEYWTKTKNTKINLWDKELGYAKILTYKKPEFRPISMKCTQDQFENILPMLEGKIKFETLYKDFEGEYNYLTNFYSNQNNSLGFRNKFLFSNEEIIEKWDEKVFLEACGIEDEEEETFVITKEQILQLYEMIETHIPKYSKDSLKEWFPQAFKEDVKELVVGKWYRGTYTDLKDPVNNSIFYCAKLILDKVYAYGIDYKGNWSDEEYWCRKDYNYKIVEATEEEVFEALKNEAVKRGYVDEAYYRWINCPLRKVYGNEYIYDGGVLRINGFTIMDSNGKWAEIIPTITIKEAEKLLNKKII